MLLFRICGAFGSGCFGSPLAVALVVLTHLQRWCGCSLAWNRPRLQLAVQKWGVLEHQKVVPTYPTELCHIETTQLFCPCQSL
jgi:hypothetical protein